jgi:transposase
MTYALPAVEQAMKVQEAILRAFSGRQPWLQVAEVLGVTARTVRRLRLRYEQYGYDGLFDRRRRRPSPRCAPVEEVQRILRLYREQYVGFNARYFCDIARRQHELTLSYTFVKKALQGAALLPKQRPRGRHRRRREPPGAAAQIDAVPSSSHGHCPSGCALR